MKQRNITFYSCERCGFESKNIALVEACEAAPVPTRPPLIVGNEVLLRLDELREGKSFDRARVVDVFVESDHISPDHAIHYWCVKLDRKVYLSYKWEEYTDVVSASFVLSPERAAYEGWKDAGAV